VSLLGHKINTAKENTETFIDASKEVGIEINVERKCEVMGRGENCIMRSFMNCTHCQVQLE
jgi:hypothetical protein